MLLSIRGFAAYNIERLKIEILKYTLLVIEERVAGTGGTVKLFGVVCTTVFTFRGGTIGEEIMPFLIVCSTIELSTHIFG